MRRLVVQSAILVALVWCALAATATAATRYAAPAGGGGAPCTTPAAPCPIGAALEAAEAGDEVELAPGEYTPPGEVAVDVPDGVLLRGESRADRSAIRAENALAVKLNGTASAADLDIHSSDSVGSRGALSIDSGAVDRVGAYASDNYGCIVFAGTIRNSVCASFDSAGIGLSMPSAVSTNAVVVGSTLHGGALGLRVQTFLGTPSLGITTLNTVARGGTADIALQASDAGSSVTVNARGSNYESVSSSGAGSNSVVDLGGNQAAPPLFANAAAGDFRQLAGSPTIDAGVPGVTASPFDVLGAPRVQNGAPDIGAHESAPPPPPPPQPQTLAPPPTPPTPPPATCRGKRATIVGTAGADNLKGTAGRDVVVARGGSDRIRTFGGNDLICAGAGPDSVWAGSGKDVVLAQGGHDFVRGGGGRDFLFGHRGNDRIAGDGGPDRVVGGAGADILKGHAGPDRILGGGWGDILKGGPGADVLKGGKGTDLLAGNGGGRDLCDGQGGRDRRATPGCERRRRIP